MPKVKTGGRSSARRSAGSKHAGRAGKKGKGKRRASGRSQSIRGKSLGSRKVVKSSKIKYQKLEKSGLGALRNISEGEISDRIIFAAGRAYWKEGGDIEQVIGSDTLDALFERLIREAGEGAAELDAGSIRSEIMELYSVAQELDITIDYSQDFEIFRQNTLCPRNTFRAERKNHSLYQFAGERLSLKALEEVCYLRNIPLRGGDWEGAEEGLEEGRALDWADVTLFMRAVDESNLGEVGEEEELGVLRMRGELAQKVILEAFRLRARTEDQSVRGNVKGSNLLSKNFFDAFNHYMASTVKPVYEQSLSERKDGREILHWLISASFELHIAMMAMVGKCSMITTIYSSARLGYRRILGDEEALYQHAAVDAALNIFGTHLDRVLLDSVDTYVLGSDGEDCGAGGPSISKILYDGLCDETLRAGRENKSRQNELKIAKEQKRRAQIYENMFGAMLATMRRKVNIEEGKKEHRAAEARKVRMSSGDIAARRARAQAAVNEVMSTAGPMAGPRGVGTEETEEERGMSTAVFESECEALSKSGQFLAVPDAGEAEAIYGKLEEAGQDVFDAVMKANGRVTQVKVLELGEAIAMILEETGYGEVGRRLVENLGKHDEHVAHQRNRARVELGGEYLGNWRKAFLGAGLYWEGVDVGSRMLGDALERLRKLRRAGEIKREREANLGVGGSGA